ncbi:MAG: hypothetical protein WAU74_23155 [Pseudolabrys sp.]
MARDVGPLAGHAQQSALPVIGPRKATSQRVSVIVSGLVDSGREIGHGNIDTNDPKRPSARRRILNAIR